MAVTLREDALAQEFILGSSKEAKQDFVSMAAQANPKVIKKLGIERIESRGLHTFTHGGESYLLRSRKGARQRRYVRQRGLERRAICAGEGGKTAEPIEQPLGGPLRIVCLDAC